MGGFIRTSLFAALMLGVSSVALAQSATPETKTGTAVISGSVKLNGNAARGVTVMTVRENYEEKQAMARLGNIGSLEITQKVKTDEEGHFRFSELAAGNYRVYVSAPTMIGFKASSPKTNTTTKSAEAKLQVTPVTKKDDEEEEDEDENDQVNIKNTEVLNMGSGQRYLQLGDGQVIENLEFSLTRGCVITGRVTYADGRPVIGEMVTVSKVADSQPHNTYPINLGGDSFLTDDRGIYRIYGLADGRYKISVGFRGRESLLGISNPSSHKRTYYPNVTDEASAGFVEVASGSEVRGVDIKVGASAKMFVVTGRVVDVESGKPVPNVSVIFERARNSSGEAHSNGFTEADAKGDFRFESVASGAYMAYSLDGLLKQSEYYGEPTKFEVKDANLSGMILKVRRGATLSGVVVLEGSNDVQATTRLAQQTLMAVSGSEKKTTGDNEDGEAAEMLGFSIAQSPIAADGSFQLKGLRAGKVQIGLGTLLTQSSFAVLRIEHGGIEVPGSLELKANESLSDLRIYVAQKNCVLRGQVQIEGGSLPKNNSLYVIAKRLNRNAEPGSFNLLEGANQDSARVDASGQFRFDDLIPGEYEVSIMGNERLNLDNHDAPPPTKQTVLVSRDREAEVTLVFTLKPKK